MSAGAGRVFLVEEPLAAAVGAGLDISRPTGNMIIDIGGGTTDIAVISYEGIVNSKSVRVAGESFDDTIKNYLKNINIENRICSYFDKSAIDNMLENYGKMYSINYRDLLINVFELTITNAVFSFIINRNYKIRPKHTKGRILGK